MQRYLVFEVVLRILSNKHIYISAGFVAFRRRPAGFRPTLTISSVKFNCYTFNVLAGGGLAG